MSTLVGGIGISLIHLYSIFNLQLVCPFFFNLILKCQTETVNGTSNSKLYLPFFTRAILKEQTFGLCLYVLRLCNVQVFYCIQLVQDLNL